MKQLNFNDKRAMGFLFNAPISPKKTANTPKAVAVNPNECKTRRRIEDILDARRIAADFAL